MSKRAKSFDELSDQVRRSWSPEVVAVHNAAMRIFMREVEGIHSHTTCDASTDYGMGETLECERKHGHKGTHRFTYRWED